MSKYTDEKAQSDYADDMKGGAMIKCPKCGLECDGFAPREKRPYFLHCECECGFEFAHDTYREEYYSLNGDLIKKGGEL